MGETLTLQVIGLKNKANEFSLKLSDGTYYIKALMSIS